MFIELGVLSLLMLLLSVVVLIALLALLAWLHPFKFIKNNIWIDGLFSVLRLREWRHHRQLQQENAGRFLDQQAQRDLFSSAHQGLLLDGRAARLSDEDSFRNLAVIATTGAGKTASFILPNLFSLDDRSLVATDPSGALYARTSDDLLRRGYQVFKLDPLHLDQSIGYNPLEGARTTPEMQEIAHILVHTANQWSKADPFWMAGAEEILGIFIKCLKTHSEAARFANLANVLHLLNNFGNGEALIPFVAANAPDDQTYHSFKGFINQSDKTLQGMVSQAKMALSILTDPDVATLTSRGTFDFAQLRRQKTALFLVFPQNRVSYYALLANLFYTQLFHYCLDDRVDLQWSLPIYFLLDEFGHLSIPHFPSIITTTRQRRISLSLVLQSISQLEERYGKQGAHTILNGGVASRLFFSGMDIETAQVLSRTIGEIHRERKDTKGNVRSEREPLMSAAALRAMPDQQVLYLFANKRPALLNVTPFYARRDFNKRIEAPPFCPPSSGLGVVELVQW